MSTALLVIAAIVIAVDSVILFLQCRKINRLKEGQRRWRDIAIYHDKAKKAAEAEAKNVRSRFTQCGEIIDLWEARFRKLVVFIWGEPPVDRTLQNVTDYIGELRAAYELKEKSNEGLAAIVRRHNSELQTVRTELQQTKETLDCVHQEARDSAALIGTLIEKAWMIQRHVGTGRFLILAVDEAEANVLRTIGGGDTPEEALRQALGQIPAPTAE